METRKGFTLVELLMVVAILAVLAGVVVPRILDYRDEARVARDDANISNLERAIELYRFTEEALPTAIGDITTATYFPHGVPVCPYGDPYVLTAGGLITAHSH